MTLQDVLTTVSDGNLGASPPSSAKVACVVGYASGVTAGSTTYVPSLSAAKALGFGPGAEECAHILAESGVGCILACPTTSAGVVSSVTPEIGGGPAMTVSGSPYDVTDAKVKITLGGAVGVSKFSASFDGGQTWSPEAFTAASYPVAGTGLTLAFAAGTYVLNEVYKFTTTSPSYSTVRMGAAIDAAVVAAGIPEFGLVKLTGTATGVDDAAKATACATMAAALQSKLNAMVTNPHRFLRGGLDAPDIADSELATAFASFVGDRVWLCARFGRIVSEITGRQNLAPLGRIMFASIPAKPIGKDPSQVKRTGEKGVGTLPAALLSIVIDEKNAATSLDSLRITTARTYDGKVGLYATNWWLMGVPGTDYRYLQDGQVIDEACRVARAKALDYLSLDLDLNEDGTLEESQAKAMDSEVDDAVRDAVVRTKDATNCRVLFDRTVNVATLEKLAANVGVQRKGYPKMFEMKVGFMKPTKAEA